MVISTTLTHYCIPSPLHILLKLLLFFLAGIWRAYHSKIALRPSGNVIPHPHSNVSFSFRKCVSIVKQLNQIYSPLSTASGILLLSHSHTAFHQHTCSTSAVLHKKWAKEIVLLPLLTVEPQISKVKRKTRPVSISCIS